MFKVGYVFSSSFFNFLIISYSFSLHSSQPHDLFSAARLHASAFHILGAATTLPREKDVCSMADFHSLTHAREKHQEEHLIDPVRERST